MKKRDKTDGKERHLLEMIAGQERKIEACKLKIAEIQAALEVHRLVSSQPSSKPIDLTGYCGKILYTSEKAAHKARKLINRDLKKEGKELMRRAYHCHECDAWHLTTMPSWLPYPETGGYARTI